MEFKSDIDVKLIDKMGDDARIAMAAWVSTSAEDGLRRAIEKPDDVPGVINYLMKHRHGTPFEHGTMTFFVRAPIFVWREWHRHRIGFSYNEESGRYKQLDPVFYIPDRNRPMFKVDNWKPGRPKFMTIEQYQVVLDSTTGGSAENLYKRLIANLRYSYEQSYEAYVDNLSMSIDPGLARDCLNVGIYSACWVTCNPRSIMAFLSLRTHEPESNHVSYPLWEIELAARACEQLFSTYWPLTYKAFNDNGRTGP